MKKYTALIITNILVSCGCLWWNSPHYSGHLTFCNQTINEVSVYVDSFYIMNLEQGESQRCRIQVNHWMNFVLLPPGETHWFGENSFRKYIFESTNGEAMVHPFIFEARVNDSTFFSEELIIENPSVIKDTIKIIGED